MRDRLSPRLQGLAALVVAMALCGATAAAPLHAKKGHAYKPPVQQSAPQPVHYIHCAMELGEGPCGLDPAMQRVYTLVERIGREISRAAGAAVSEDGAGIPEGGLRFVAAIGG